VFLFSCDKEKKNCKEGGGEQKKVNSFIHGGVLSMSPALHKKFFRRGKSATKERGVGKGEAGDYIISQARKELTSVSNRGGKSLSR